MAGVSISNPVATMDGIEFIAVGPGVNQKFLVHREGLEDLEYEILETGPEMLKVFDRHKGHIAVVAAKALHEGRGGPSVVVLQTLLI
jgi:hypothetical protein